ncbi:MAG: tRNA glutamyl-Q(34) synthetase GluQRS [Pseudomonadota bacterium]|nr:tRNA glutamyl-Q(34) synthetase GluQRS [Pseudomonadota bacterium]
MPRHYVGRFAPSPTGLLHAGSLVAALASWLDARANSGRWLIRIEDLDTARNVAGAATRIVDQLAHCGLVADEAPTFQSLRTPLYGAALERLLENRKAFPCGCSRRDLELDSGRPIIERTPHAERIYPGTCRDGLHGKAARSFRLRSAGPSTAIDWVDRRLGLQFQDVATSVGDFVLRRADGVWAYQLAVVVDDAAQGVTDIVRGEDLAGNTARQILLQHALALPTPRYLHTPLVLSTSGDKLSKQTGAEPLELGEPLLALRAAATILEIEPAGATIAGWLTDALTRWRRRWPLP